MSKILPYLSRIFVVILVVTVFGAPFHVEAASAKKSVRYDLYNPKKKYKDEKVDPANPTSRCNTPAFRKLHEKNLDRALEDGKPFDLTFEVASTTEPLSSLQEAYKKYLFSLQMGLEAMEEPYCGFGAFGTQAANKSYNKTIERARSRFLEAVKQDKISKKKAAPKTVAKNAD